MSHREAGRFDARSACLATLAGLLAYFAGQIIVRPSAATQQGLTPIADLVPLESTGWACMGIAAGVLFCAVFRTRCWWVDRCGFALATFPLVMWFGSFAWTWAGRGGYPVGGAWGFFAVLTTLANMFLARGPRIGKAESDERADR